MFIITNTEVNLLFEHKSSDLCLALFELTSPHKQNFFKVQKKYDITTVLKVIDKQTTDI